MRVNHNKFQVSRRKTTGVRSATAKTEIPIRKGGQTTAKTRDIAGRTMADDENEHEHSEGGEMMMSGDNDLIKVRVEEREEMFRFGFAAMVVNIGIRVDFFNFSIYIKII